VKQWLDDAGTLLFKRALLLKQQLEEVAIRYWHFARRATVWIGGPILAMVAVFFLCSLIGLKAEGVYYALILLIGFGLVALIVVWLPLLIPLEAIVDALPDGARTSIGRWPRRMAAVLFYALLAVVLIKLFKLYRDPGQMLMVALLLAVMWLGGFLGWMKVSPVWRRIIAAKMQVTLLVILLLALLPGPAGLVQELVDWGGGKVEQAVYGVTRADARYWEPESAEQLQAAFVDQRSGRHQVWYTRLEDGGFKVSRAKGYDDFGEPLELADTKSEMESLLEWQRRKDRARKAAELQRQLEAERRAAEEAERQRQARLEAERKAAEEAERQRLARLEAERQAEARRIASYIGAYPQEPAHYAVFAVDARGERVLELMSEITKSLHSIEGMKVTDQAFAAPFASEEGFERVVSGRGEDELGAMEVRKAADSLLLIRAGREEVGRSTQVSDVQTFSMPVTVTIISTSDGAIQHEYAVNDVTGAGVSEPAAKTAYIERLSTRIAEVVARP